MILQAIFFELEAVRAEGVGQDNLRPGFDVLAMDFGDDGRVGQIQLVEAFFKADAARVEHGAHRAIGQEGLFV